MTQKTAKAKAKGFINRNYPQASFKWVMRLQKVKYPTGLIGYAGKVELSAPGFKKSVMQIYVDSSSVYTR